MGLNVCTFTGRMVRDAEDIGTTGEAVKFSVAVDGYDFSAKAKKTIFVECVAFGKRVAVLKNYAGKGREIGISGKYDQREYIPQSGPNAGIKRIDHVFVIETVELLSGQPAGQQAQFQGGPSAGPQGDPNSGW